MLRVTVAAGLTAATLLAVGTAFTQVQTPAPGKRRALPVTKFYDTPHPLPAGKPGELIRSESFEEYELPLAVSAVRILYHSRSAAGEDVATSGVVLIPYGRKPPAGGWPVIAWAHGATGVARSCAPSLMRNVGHGPFLAMYVNLGYAVVATDYTGLGTDSRNAFLDGPSNATDVINSVLAARGAVPQLGAKWIVMGETEGSLAAVAVAEKETEIRDPGYLGSIVISGLAGAKEIFEHMLSGKALALYHHLAQTCWDAGATAELSPAETVKPGWDDNQFVRQYFVRNSLAQTRAYGPMMVISGDADQAIPAMMTAQAIARMCKQGDLIQWQRYPSLDPGRVMGDSVRDQIAWIEARFAGRTTTANCP